MQGKNILVLYTSANTKGKKDATGAFIPESKEFARIHDIPRSNILGVPCPEISVAQRFRLVTKFIRSHQRIKWIAMFCHGYSTGMQFGFNRKNLSKLVESMQRSCSRKVKLTLYACSTASTSKKTRLLSMPGTDNGYADKLRDEMIKGGFKGGWIDAHLTPGHTTRNPFVIRFYTEPPFENGWDMPGGEWLVSPKSKLWKMWKRDVRSMQSSFRFQFGGMTEKEIYAHLA